MVEAMLCLLRSEVSMGDVLWRCERGVGGRRIRRKAARSGCGRKVSAGVKREADRQARGSVVQTGCRVVRATVVMED